MTPSREQAMKLERGALWTAAISGAVGLGLSCLDPGAAAMAYRFAVFACMAPAMGSLIFILIHRITGGQWVSSLAPFLRAAADLLPWIWLFALPMLFFPTPVGSGAPRLAHAGLAYDGFAMVALRAGVIAVVFFGFRWAVADGVGREKDPVNNPRPWVGPVGLIVLVFMATILADDWLESLEPRWHSTAFSVVWMAGQVVSGLALALLGGLWSGARPDSTGSAGRLLGPDWGNLLLTTMIFWCYVAFAQFLIIWAGNLPDEISWYLRREQGVWEFVMPGVAIFGFAVPFLLLLSRRVKSSRMGLGWMAGMLLAAQLAYIGWVILPAGGPPSLDGMLLSVSILAALAGIFINRYARLARCLREGSP